MRDVSQEKLIKYILGIPAEERSTELPVDKEQEFLFAKANANKT